MKKNQLPFVEGSTHIVITGTYNKVLGFVKFGDNMQERIESAIVKSILNDRRAGTVVLVDLEKQVAIETAPEGGYQHKHPFTIAQITES